MCTSWKNRANLVKAIYKGNNNSNQDINSQAILLPQESSRKIYPTDIIAQIVIK